MGSLVSVDWLHDHLDDPTLRVLDCTVHLVRGERGYERRSGRADWEAAHVPGARFADLIDALSAPHPTLAFMRPDAARFAAAMEALGVGDGTRVVLYDNRGSMWATRVWWLLRSFGFDDAFVLDGGWAAWQAAGAPVSAEATPAPAATFTVMERHGLFVGADHVASVVERGGACLLDALAPEQYAGTVSAYARPGHIPGARNVPAMHLLDAATGRFRPAEELRALFADQLASSEPVVVYCGGGIAATADAFALTMLGRDDVAVYDGSLSEWTADPSRPMELA